MQIPFKLTDKQSEAIKLFSIATFILLFGGSRSTKTFTIIRTIVNRAIAAPGSRHAILRFRFNHAKTSIWHDTFPKVMTLCFPQVKYLPNKSDWFFELENGSQIWIGGLDDKERTEKILGNEYVTIFLNECSQIAYSSYLIVVTRLAQKVYYERDGRQAEMSLKLFCDENPPSKGHWTHKLFIDKVEPEDKKKVDNPDDYAYLLMNPADNAENLPKIYLDSLARLPKRKRDRFYLGKFGDDAENALWTTETIERNKVDGSGLPDMVRLVVAVDPSGAAGEEGEANDPIGIVVAGLGTDGFAYVLEDLTLLAAPAVWGRVACNAYERHEADRIVAEVNYGGAMVENVIKTANPNVSYKSVNASRGKVVRAEPISALHETGKIKFVGDFSDLEDELCDFTTTGYIGQNSPNRADAFVWAITELFPSVVKDQTKTKDYRNEPRDYRNSQANWMR